jgi:hypothetical protein
MSNSFLRTNSASNIKSNNKNEPKSRKKNYIKYELHAVDAVSFTNFDESLFVNSILPQKNTKKSLPTATTNRKNESRLSSEQQQHHDQNLDKYINDCPSLSPNSSIRR